MQIVTESPPIASAVTESSAWGIVSCQWRSFAVRDSDIERMARIYVASTLITGEEYPLYDFVAISARLV